MDKIHYNWLVKVRNTLGISFSHIRNDFTVKDFDDLTEARQLISNVIERHNN